MLARRKKVEILKALTGNVQQVGQLCPNCWLGLLQTAPVDGETATSYTEVTGQGYSRTLLGEYNQGSVSNNKITVAFDETEGNVVATNSSTIIIAECETGDWSAATYFGLFGSDAGNDLIAWGKLKDSQGHDYTLQPAAGEIPVIRKNQLKITID